MSIEKELEAVMKEYMQDVGEISNEAGKKAARFTRDQLRKGSPKDTGDYAKGWTVKTEKLAGGTEAYTVHNKTHYYLTHLLENGHMIRNKKGQFGRAPAHPHIKKAEELGIQQYIDTLEQKL